MDILTAFEGWLAKHNSTLAITMTVVARAPASIRLRFVGIIDAIEVFVLRDEIVVTVEHEDLCWDILAKFQCTPLLVTGGVACGHCDPADRVVHPTHQAQFVEQVFEPLADWIATSLVTARALGLGGSNESGSTWAGLLPANPTKDYDVIVAIRG
jgi:hypothetical protein